MGEIVNLNRARKARVKTEAKSKAQANRVLHGVTKADKDLARATRQKAAQVLDQTRRDPPAS